MRKIILPILILAYSFIAHGKEPGDSIQMIMDELKRMDSIEKSLNYKTGTIVLANGIATINVPKGFKFLDADEAAYVIYDLWGNLRGGENPLGMIFPESGGATAGSYAFLIEYEAIGYVKDKDADKINYDDLLEDIKKSQVEANEQRRALGLETMEIVGWASKPFYDKDRKILHWAKEFTVSGSDVNTLNYDIRVLGRRGILTLQAIAEMTEYDSVSRNIDNVLGMVSFNPGNTYADFDSKTDEVAAWTIGGLVAGKILAKAGFFALILKNIKLVILGLIAVGGGIWRFITGRRKKEEEFVYTPATPPASNDTNNPGA